MQAALCAASRTSVPGVKQVGMLQWLSANANILAVLVTAGVAVLLVCCLECSDCSHKEKDDLFRRHEI